MLPGGFPVGLAYVGAASDPADHRGFRFFSRP